MILAICSRTVEFVSSTTASVFNFNLNFNVWSDGLTKRKREIHSSPDGRRILVLFGRPFGSRIQAFPEAIERFNLALAVVSGPGPPRKSSPPVTTQRHACLSIVFRLYVYYAFVPPIRLVRVRMFEPLCSAPVFSFSNRDGLRMFSKRQKEEPL